MTDQQELFCLEYLVDLNATRAAERAGYSIKTAAEQACRLLKNVKVQERIAELKRARDERTEVTIDRVVKELALVGFSDIADLLEVNADGTIRMRDLDTLAEGASRTIKSVKENRVTKKQKKKGEDTETEILYDRVSYETHDKLRALEMLGKHLSMFTDLKLDLGDGFKAVLETIITDKRPTE